MENTIITLLSGAFLVWLAINEVFIDAWHGPRKRGNFEAYGVIHKGRTVYPDTRVPVGQVMGHSGHEGVYMNPGDYFTLLREMRLQETLAGRIYIALRTIKIIIQKRLKRKEPKPLKRVK